MLDRKVGKATREQMCRETPIVELGRVAVESLTKLVNEAREAVRGMCCFSEVNNDALMWGHYAHGNRGM